MKGTVDEFGRALVTVKLRSNENRESTEVLAWVDTAFNGELLMPASMITAAGLQQSGGIRARLADGSEVTLESFGCELDWFGNLKWIEVIANDGEMPLLGIGLLIGRKLTVDYAKMTVVIE
ncbi:MAG: hypothetical protein WKF77_28435 [Planctomycetaceae bacterium]